MQQETQLPEHKWLEQMLGDWTFEGEFNMGPDKPPMKSTGTETFRTIGGLWFLGEGESEMPGAGTGRMIMTLGYDAKEKKYVGTWIGSMMSRLWVYNASMSADGKTLMLDAEGESMKGDGSKVQYRDSVTIVDKDHRTLTSQTQDDSGKWAKFMEVHYTRVR